MNKTLERANELGKEERRIIQEPFEVENLPQKIKRQLIAIWKKPENIKISKLNDVGKQINIIKVPLVLTMST